MAKFKISIHCGQVNTYTVEEHADKDIAMDIWKDKIDRSECSDMFRVGDVLINPKQITFVVVEEAVEQGAEPAAGTTVDV